MSNKKIKIALMSYAFDERRGKGTALYAQKLIEQMLSDERFDFYLVHYKKSDVPIYARAKEIIMPKVRLPYGSHFISHLLFFWKYRNNQFDIIHWFQPRIYPLYSFAPAKKIIVTMHGAGDISAPHDFIFSRFIFNIVLKYFHKSVDVAIVVSNHAKYEVERYYNFSTEKIVSIYNGGGENFQPIEKNKVIEVLKKYGILRPYILDISRFIPHKNVVTLIKAYTFFREKYPNHSELLVVVGGQTSQRRDEYDERDKSPFAKDIIFVPFVTDNDLNAIYSGAELFVFPSLSEGFGLPVLEAMASGTPVITSNVASMGEIGGEAVETIDPLDVEGLSDTVHNILEDRPKMAKMRELGLIRAKEFTWKSTAEQTKSIYLEQFQKIKI